MGKTAMSRDDVAMLPGITAGHFEKLYILWALFPSILQEDRERDRSSDPGLLSLRNA